MINETVNTQSQPEQTVVVIDKRGNALGIVSFVFGIISIFVLAPLFVPLALLFGILGLIWKQFLWSILGIFSAIIGFVTSPILLGLFGLVTVATLTDFPDLPPTASRPPSPTIVNPVKSQRPQVTSSTSSYTPAPTGRTGTPVIGKRISIAEYANGVSGKWVGTYICRQGVTGLTLKISTSSSNMSAVFDFYPTNQNPGKASGSFSLSGQLQEDASFSLNPQSWINGPAGYSMVGLSGVINDDFTKMEGSVLSGGCSTFQLHKVPDTAAAPLPHNMPQEGTLSNVASQTIKGLPPSISEQSLRESIKDFYNKKGEWAGQFIIDRIENIKIVKMADDSRHIHVRYRYAPAAGRQSSSGVDQRIFILSRIGESYAITRMRGHMSARF